MRAVNPLRSRLGPSNALFSRLLPQGVFGKVATATVSAMFLAAEGVSELAADEYSVFFDSKENFDKNYQSNWYYYFK